MELLWDRDDRRSGCELNHLHYFLGCSTSKRPRVAANGLTEDGFNCLGMCNTGTARNVICCRRTFIEHRPLRVALLLRSWAPDPVSNAGDAA